MHCLDDFGGEVATHDLYGCLACNLPAIMSAHAIRNYADILAFQNCEAIFVFLPDFTDVA